ARRWLRARPAWRGGAEARDGHPTAAGVRFHERTQVRRESLRLLWRQRARDRLAQGRGERVAGEIQHPFPRAVHPRSRLELRLVVEKERIETGRFGPSEEVALVEVDQRPLARR